LKNVLSGIIRTLQARAPTQRGGTPLGAFPGGTIRPRGKTMQSACQACSFRCLWNYRSTIPSPPALPLAVR
jgi:hypothetical protein